MFALSLDLILGYAGIISLGHAAFFGLGSYVAALLAKHAIISEPVLALIVSGLCAAILGFATSFLVLRGSDLTRLMVTLGVALIMREIANQIPEITGVAIYTMAAFYAGIAGALLAQTTSFASLDVFSFERSADLLLVLIIGGTGYLYGGLIGAVIFKLMQDWIANLTPQYWQFWIGLVLVLIVLIGRDRIGLWTSAVRVLGERITRRFAPGAVPSSYPPSLAGGRGEKVPGEGR